MPNPSFNASFFETTFLLSEEGHDLSLLPYATPPLYFSPAGEEETQRQLEAFEHSAVYPEFKNQYEILLNHLNDWCVKHDIVKSIYPNIAEMAFFDADKPVPAFILLKHRLLENTDLFSIRRSLLYQSDGKSALEKVLVLLEEPGISLHIKKELLSNLQENIDGCPDGTLTNLLDAKSDFLAVSQGINALLGNTKRVLIQQYALEFLRLRGGVKVNQEIHYVSALSNYVAHDYGVLLREDKFIQSIQLIDEDFEDFAHELTSRFTPNTVMQYLIEQVNARLNDHFEGYKKSFIEQFGSKNVLSQRYRHERNLGKTLSSLIEGWNKQYLQFCKVDTSWFLDISEDERVLCFKEDQYHFVKAAVIRAFQQLFVLDNPLEFIVMDNYKKIFHTCGLYWVEENNEPYELTASTFALVKPLEVGSPKFNVYLDILNEMLMTMDETVNDEYIQSLQLSQEQKNYWHTYSPLEDESINRIWGLAYNKQYDLIEELLKSGRIMRKHLEFTHVGGPHTGINPLWFFGHDKKYDLIHQLLAANLITARQLMASPTKGVCAGISLLWFLANDEEYVLLDKIIDKNWLTSALLDMTDTKGLEMGSNVLWLLAASMQFVLIEKLASLSLVTQIQLNAINLNESKCGGVAFLLIAPCLIASCLFSTVLSL